jgi:hypothetical protein
MSEEEVNAIRERLDNEYDDFVEYYEDDENPTNAYKAALEQAMKDVQALLIDRSDKMYRRQADQ